MKPPSLRYSSPFFFIFLLFHSFVILLLLLFLFFFLSRASSPPPLFRHKKRISRRGAEQSHEIRTQRCDWSTLIIDCSSLNTELLAKGFIEFRHCSWELISVMLAAPEPHQNRTGTALARKSPVSIVFSSFSFLFHVFVKFENVSSLCRDEGYFSFFFLFFFYFSLFYFVVVENSIFRVFLSAFYGRLGRSTVSLHSEPIPSFDCYYHFRTNNIIIVPVPHLKHILKNMDAV